MWKQNSRYVCFATSLDCPSTHISFMATANICLKRNDFIILHSDNRMFSLAWNRVIYLPKARCRRKVSVLKYSYVLSCIASKNKWPAYIMSAHGHQPKKLAQYCQKCPEQKGNSLTTKKKSFWQFFGPAMISFEWWCLPEGFMGMK